MSADAPVPIDRLDPRLSLASRDRARLAADAAHYRQMAGKLRATGYPNLADSYDELAAYFAGRATEA